MTGGCQRRAHRAADVTWRGQDRGRLSRLALKVGRAALVTEAALSESDDSVMD